MSELRWDATRDEWIIVAPRRHERTYQPPADLCPLCPSPPGGRPTEVPVETFEIAVFENRFPSLGERARDPARDGGDALHRTSPAPGRCEVVVYTPRHEGSLGGLSARRIERLLRVWADRYRELGARDDVRCVFIFENRGPEIGVTLHHPHGQIYAYPFVPSIPAREIARERAHADETGGRCLHCDLRAREEADGARIVVDAGEAVGWVPFAARWPYEMRLSPRAHRPSLLALEPAERRDLAVALKRTLEAYDRLFGKPMPYILAVRQAPTEGDAGPGAHLRIDLYPARRAADKLKHRAGSETSMGVAVHDVGPENAAEKLREVV